MSKEKFNVRSRSSNMMLNTIFGIVSYVMIIVTSFVLRKVFADKLGEAYLGLNSLFSNIISMLSLTELGLGTAMVFFLYEPIAKRDTEKLKTYMRFYRNTYRLIALIVMVLGCILLFFLPFIIKDNPIAMNEVRFYFILYVINSSLSYLFAYKKSMLYADQRNRVTSISHMTARILMYVIQFLVLLIWQSFFGYIVVMIVATFAENLACSIFVDKNYSFLKEKDCAKLTKEQKKEIYAKVWPLLVQNLSVFLVDSIDNILISAFIGIGVVGKYSNYTLVLGTLTTLYYQVFSAFSSSFGNLSVSEDREYCEKIYSNISFLAFMITSVFMFCYVSLIQPFIILLFGENFVMELSVPICLAVSFMINAISTPSSSAQNAVGLHRKDVWFLVAQGLLNLVVSIVLVNLLGVIGVILGTIIAKSLTTLYSKEYVMYKFFFKKSMMPTMIRKAIYMISIGALCALGYWVFNVLWPDITPWHFVAKIVTSGISIVVILVLATCWTPQFKYYVGVAKRILKRR